MKKLLLIAISSLLLLCFLPKSAAVFAGSNNGRSQNNPGSFQLQQTDNLNNQGLADSLRREKRQKLRKMHQKDPEEFNDLMQEKKQLLDQLKEEDHERFEQKREQRQKIRSKRHRQIRDFKAEKTDPSIRDKRREAVRARYQKMQKLRTQDPQMFESLIDQRKNSFQRNMRFLKRNDPEEFQRLRSEIRQDRYQRFKKLKEDNPDKFNELMSQRKKIFREKLEQLKKVNPQAYEKIVSRMEKIGQYRSLKQEDPHKAQMFLESDPELRKIIDKHGFGAGHDAR
jgi:hypothetical protein